MRLPRSPKADTNARASFSLPLSEWKMAGCGWWSNTARSAWLVSGEALAQRYRRTHDPAGEEIHHRDQVRVAARTRRTPSKSGTLTWHG